VRFADATLAFTPRVVNGDGGTLDLTELDLDADHLTGATLDLAIDNALAVRGDATLRIRRGAETVVAKQFPFTDGRSTTAVAFTSEELQRLRGASLALSLEALVRASAASGEVVVRPGDAIRIESTFTAAVRPTGTPSRSR
jgi:hypothetical protein